MGNMTLRSYLLNKSIWGEIKTLSPFAFIDNVDYLDRELVNLHGQKLMFEPYEIEPLEYIAYNIVKNYSDKWNSLLNISLNIGSSGDGVTTETKIINTDTTGNVNGLQKVSGYNSDELVIDSGNTTDSINSLDTNETTTLNNSNLSYQNLFENLNYSDKTNIMNVVLKDVANYLTISIY